MVQLEMFMGGTLSAEARRLHHNRKRPPSLGGEVGLQAGTRPLQKPSSACS